MSGTSTAIARRCVEGQQASQQHVQLGRRQIPKQRHLGHFLAIGQRRLEPRTHDQVTRQERVEFRLIERQDTARLDGHHRGGTWRAMEQRAFAEVVTALEPNLLLSTDLDFERAVRHQKEAVARFTLTNYFDTARDVVCPHRPGNLQETRVGQLGLRMAF